MSPFYYPGNKSGYRYNPGAGYYKNIIAKNQCYETFFIGCSDLKFFDAP